MKRVLALIFLSATLAQANDEITIDLPGGVPLEMVWIEPGSFTMGSPEIGVTPREVTISQGFYLGKYEITQEQWQAVVGTAPWSSAPSSDQGPRYPAIYISWHDAQAFTQKLNDHFGEDAYRLPTEAEWEYACRAGTTTRWSFGDDQSLLASYAWYSVSPRDTRPSLHPVGTKLPNPWDLFDMHGNVWEWVYDLYNYNDHDGTPQTDPTGPTAIHSYRVQKGGSSYQYAQHTTSAVRVADSSLRGHLSSGARLLKGAPLNIALPTPFPQDSSGPFLPIHEGNIWIMASHYYDPYGPPSVGITAYVLHRSEVIEGKQYWEWVGRPPAMLWSPFRLDENGNIWERIQDRWTSDAIHDLLWELDESPELRASHYYQQSSFFQSLGPDQKELLLYEFDGVPIDLGLDSPTPRLDEELRALHSKVFTIERFIEEGVPPAPNQRSFFLMCCGTEFSGKIIFQRGLGPVRITWVSALFGNETNEELVWARINGKEYGLHPGPGYPGYREVITAVASSELTSARPPTSGLDPNFPNPFNASTQIAYHLATSGPVRLTIYNTLGQPVRTLMDQFQAAGSYQVRWDARDQRGTALAAGVYLVRLHYPGGEQTRRLLLLK